MRNLARGKVQSNHCPRRDVYLSENITMDKPTFSEGQRRCYNTKCITTTKGDAVSVRHCAHGSDRRVVKERKRSPTAVEGSTFVL